jgi:hypothetical protein
MQKHGRAQNSKISEAAVFGMPKYCQSNYIYGVIYGQQK